MKPLLAVLGVLLLLPGLCGTFYFTAALLDTMARSTSDPYAIIIFAIAVPSIQAGCLGLFLLARESTNTALRTAAKIAGWFGALAAAALIAYFVARAPTEVHGFEDGVMFAGLALIAAVLPVLIGGLQAIRIDRGRGGAK